MLIQCRRCDCTYKVTDNLRGIAVPCPDCGTENTATELDVIDVEYEVQGGAYPAEASSPNDREEEADIADAPGVYVEELETPWGTQRAYTVYVQRQMEGNGCPCFGLGCLIFVVSAFLFVRGCMSLF